LISKKPKKNSSGDPSTVVKNLTPTEQPVSEGTEKLEESEPAATKTATKGAVDKRIPRVTKRQLQLAEDILESETPAKHGKSGNGIAKFFTPCLQNSLKKEKYPR
jgi:hypothetical protein